MDGIIEALAALSERAQQKLVEATAPPPQPQKRSIPTVTRKAPQPPPPAHAPQPPPKAPERTGALQALFEDGNSLLRAIVAAEVLGPPAALREHTRWNQRPNEPSI
jgi:hypothetical protein